MRDNRSNQKRNLWENLNKVHETKVHLEDQNVYGDRSNSSTTKRQVVLEKDVAVDTSIW